MKDIKYICFGILIIYLSFVGAYVFNQNTHELFLCEPFKIIGGWNCTQLHIVTTMILFFLLALGLIALFFRNQLK